MPQDATPNQRLADSLLGGPVVEYIREKRDSIPQWSWRLIARQLLADTGGQVDVTSETLRLWYVESLAEPDDLNAAV
ncbi:MAG: hypothetical protein ABI862_18410 [Ilumatobacteraceae bacterium]